MLLESNDILQSASVAAMTTDASATVAPRPAVTTRPARVADMLQVEPLIARFAAEGLMLPKTLEFLNRNFREFVVAVDEHGTVLGCGAVRVYTAQLAEVASLAVSPDAHGLGVGRRIVAQLEVAGASAQRGVLALRALLAAFGPGAPLSPRTSPSAG